MPFRQPGHATQPWFADVNGYAYAVTPAAAKPKKHPPRGELALIELIRQRATSLRASSALKLGIGDDCAILRPGAGDEVLVTTDFSLEGRHFRRDWHTPVSVGHRTLARGLSDLASMGAKPLGALLSLALPRSVARDTRWLNGFLDGFLALAAHCEVSLAGGDLSESPSEHILADIVVVGSAPSGTALRRSGARVGDALYCTGALGGAAAELDTLAKRRVRGGLGRDHPHLFPAPRLAVGKMLRARRLATACIDISDGLSTDLAHLCEASGVDAEVDPQQVPLHPRTKTLQSGDALQLALHGGEDYELLFTAAAHTRVPRVMAGVPIARIGTIVRKRRGARPKITLVDKAGSRSPLIQAGWEHLR